MTFKVIDAEKAKIPVRRSCSLLNVSMSGYYAWRSRQPSQRQRRDMVLLAHIRAQFTTWAPPITGRFDGSDGWLSPLGEWIDISDDFQSELLLF